MKEMFLEPEIEIVSFESLDNICAGGVGGPGVESIPGGDDELWFPDEEM